MSAFTRVGPSLWNWEPFTQLDSGPQVLWMALYTTAEAKRIMPGLWQGSITAMAEAAHKPVDEARLYLDALLAAELVEFDIKLRVLRLTQLPDAGESPPNGNVLRGWFRKFLTLPACAVRDAHIPLVRWLMETWSRESGKPISHQHEEVWKETFGRIAVPASRRRGVRRLAESDTSTPVQPSLFSRPETVSTPRLAVHEGGSVDNSDLNKIRDSETVREPSRSGSGLGSGSRSPDPDPEAAGASAQLDALLVLIGQVCGGSWRLAQDAFERTMLEDQITRLGGLDLAVVGAWMRATALRNVSARDLLAIPGRLVWASQEADRWRGDQLRTEEKASEQMATMRRELAALGLTGMVQ